MAVVPTIITNTSPVVIQSYGAGSLTYNEIVNDLGNFVYKVNSIKLVAKNFNDLYIPMNIQNISADGTKSNFAITNIPDISQRVPMIQANLQDNEIVLNSRTFINFVLQPYSSFTFILDTNSYPSRDF
jgi:hypothetical protein